MREEGRVTRACGRFRCPGCAGCDPDGSAATANETDRQRAGREQARRRAVGEPTMRVRLGDAARRRREGDE